MTQNANITITNNIMDHGVCSNGTLNATYTYTHCAWIYGNALIEGNSFLNPGTNADMLNTNTYSDGLGDIFTIRNNTFVRDTTLINSYIRHHTDSSFRGLCRITDNIFDNITTDDISDSLVIGLFEGSVYTRNKNQRGKVYIPIYDNTIGGQGVTYGVTLDSLDIGGIFGFAINKESQASVNNLITSFNQGAASTPEVFFVKRSFHLSNYLEKGMGVYSLRVGGYRSVGTLKNYSPPDSYFGARLKVHDGYANMDAKQFGILQPKIMTTYKYEIDSALKFSELSIDTCFATYSSTVGGTIPPSGNYYGFAFPDYVTIGNGYQMEVEFIAEMTFDTGTWTMFFTPIEIEYIW